MEMILISTCDVCGAKGEWRVSGFFPGYCMPPPTWNHYLPKGWHEVENILLCPAHSYRIVIERMAQPERPCIEMEQEKGATLRPFERWKEEGEG